MKKDCWLGITAKQQVVEQYGADSDGVQSVGFTKKSERAKPTRTTEQMTVFFYFVKKAWQCSAKCVNAGQFFTKAKNISFSWRRVFALRGLESHF